MSAHYQQVEIWMSRGNSDTCVCVCVWCLLWQSVVAVLEKALYSNHWGRGLRGAASWLSLIWKALTKVSHEGLPSFTKLPPGLRELRRLLWPLKWYHRASFWEHTDSVMRECDVFSLYGHTNRNVYDVSTISTYKLAFRHACNVIYAHAGIGNRPLFLYKHTEMCVIDDSWRGTQPHVVNTHVTLPQPDHTRQLYIYTYAVITHFIAASGPVTHTGHKDTSIKQMSFKELVKHTALVQI